MWDNTIEKGHSQCGSSWGDHYLGMPASLHIIINKPHQDSNLCPFDLEVYILISSFFYTCIDLIWSISLQIGALLTQPFILLYRSRTKEFGKSKFQNDGFLKGIYIYKIMDENLHKGIISWRFWNCTTKSWGLRMMKSRESTCIHCAIFQKFLKHCNFIGCHPWEK